MNYDNWTKSGDTVTRLQMIANGESLEDSSYCDYSPAAVQAVKAAAILNGLKQELETFVGEDAAGSRMLAELNAEFLFLDSVRIARRPMKPAPSRFDDQSGYIDEKGELREVRK